MKNNYLNFRNGMALFLILCYILIKYISFHIFNYSITYWNVFVNFNNNPILRDTFNCLRDNHMYLQEIKIILKQNEIVPFCFYKLQDFERILLENYQKQFSSLIQEWSTFNIYQDLCMFCEFFLIAGIFYIFYKIFYKKIQINVSELITFLVFLFGFVYSIYSIEMLLNILQNKVEFLKAYEPFILNLQLKLEIGQKFYMWLSNIKHFLKNFPKMAILYIKSCVFR